MVALVVPVQVILVVWYEKTTSLTPGEKPMAYLTGKPEGDSSIPLKTVTHFLWSYW
jgi:hypothetical protein